MHMNNFFQEQHSEMELGEVEEEYNPAIPVFKGVPLVRRPVNPRTYKVWGEGGCHP